MGTPHSPASSITVIPSDDGLVRVQADGHYSASILGRLFNNELCDVTLFGKPPPGVDASSLPPINAHKIILAVVSPLLYERFKAHGMKSNTAVYKLDHIDHNSLHNIITFIYTNRLHFPQADAARNLRSILVGAKHLAMNDLAGSCEAYLASPDHHLTPQTCISTWLFAVLYECNVLLHACLTMFAANVAVIRTLNDFLHLSGDNVILLLKSMTVEPFKSVVNADDLCQAAVAWLEYMNHDRSKRKSYVESIAKLIPFDRVSRAGLLKASRNKELEATVMPILYKAMKRKLEEVGSDDDVDGGKNDRSISGVSAHEDEADDDENEADEHEDEEMDHVKEPDRKVLRVEQKKEPVPIPTPSPTALSLLAKLPSNTPAVAPREIWAVGGSNREANRAVHKYDVPTKKWSTVSLKLPWTRSSAGTCLLAKNLMFCGGRKNSVITSDIDFYSVSKSQCFTLPNTKLRTARTGCCAVAIGDGVIICGGCEDEDGVTTVEKLVISSGKMELLAPMQRGRSDLAGVSVGNGAAVLVAGGADESTLPIEMYECPRNAWSFAGALSSVRYAMGAATLADNVYYAGGYDVNGVALDTVEVFNTRTGKLRIAESNMKQPRGACSAVCLDANTFAVFGGKTSEGAGRSRGLLQTVETFDVRTEKWIEGVVPAMPVPMVDGLVLSTSF